MSSLPDHDLAGLAMLARTGDRELRPVLLTLHTRQFASAPIRDRRMVAAYEALALGLIPLVPDDVVADVSATLRGVPETPPLVLALLGERRDSRSVQGALLRATAAALSHAEVSDLLAAESLPIDVALALNGRAPLTPTARDALVRRALPHRELARALLSRSDLSAYERAALYRHAEPEPERDRIRVELETRIAVAAVPLPPLSAWRRSRLLRFSGKGDLTGLRGDLAKVLGIEVAPDLRSDDPAVRELFALSLLAAGLTGEECVRVILTVDPGVGTCVASVFRLGQICRTTSRAVAWGLVGAEDRRRPRQPVQPARMALSGRAKVADGARALASTDEARPSPARPASAPAGHRSRSTTGRDRS